ncbi:hypothetical protein ACP70R_008452 [Stipagrostis hirtigluma subsp. patula]
MAGDGQGGLPGDYKAALAVLLTLALVSTLVRVLFCFLSVRKQQQQQDGAAAAGASTRRRGEVRQPPAPAVALEMAPAASGGAPLVCTYRRADGWREAACGVCLAELADGEAVRVLPACMHYFHAACVGEWLRRHATCPLCRAELPAATV